MGTPGGGGIDGDRSADAAASCASESAAGFAIVLIPSSIQLNKSLNIPFPTQPNIPNHRRQPHTQPIDSARPDTRHANYETIGREFEPLRARHFLAVSPLSPSDLSTPVLSSVCNVVQNHRQYLA